MNSFCKVYNFHRVTILGDINLTSESSMHTFIRSFILGDNALFQEQKYLVWYTILLKISWNIHIILWALLSVYLYFGKHNDRNKIYHFSLCVMTFELYERGNDCIVTTASRLACGTILCIRKSSCNTRADQLR